MNCISEFSLYKGESNKSFTELRLSITFVIAKK